MRRHSTDAVSLGFGVLFLAIAAWWAAGRYLVVDLNIPNLGWIAAAALILFGVIGVIASLRGDRETRREPADATTEVPVDTVPQDSSPADSSTADTVTAETVQTVPTVPTPEAPVRNEPVRNEPVWNEPAPVESNSVESTPDEVAGRKPEEPGEAQRG